MNIMLYIILILILAIFSFFFSASETSLISLNKLRIRALVNQGYKRAKVVQRLTTQLDRLITTILVGNNLVNTAISALGAAIFISFFGQRLGVVVSTVVVTFFLLVFCEITPKMLAVKYSEPLALKLARPIDFVIRVMHPVSQFFMGISNGIIRVFGVKLPRRSALITEEEIKLMIEIGKEEGVLLEEERKMLHRIFEFGDTLVKDVMVPKEKMICIELNANDRELLEILTEEGHTRLPVYAETRDNIVGMLYARDLPFMWKNGALIIIADILHPAHFVLPDKRVSDLLQDFQKMKIQIAIVRDGAEKVLGLVTLEDVLEEIVGEIDDKA
ncbi:MAG: hemolysin family protein [Candidatus Omnitrophica bacterium]|nr:hemolysin family protein [Candidatus Omnitrophota bacterium]